MSHIRMTFTKVTLEYYEIDFWAPATEPTAAVERRALAEVQVDPAKHQLGSVDSTFMLTNARIL